VSDLNFSVGRPPQVEVDGQLVPVNFPGLPRLTPFQTEMIAMHMLRGDRDLTRTLMTNGSVDLSYSIPQKTRFRVNVFAQRGTYAIVLRVIPEGVPSLEALHMPREVHNVAKLKNGIVLATGPTGSGKSTTLAAIIHQINQENAYHIIRFSSCDDCTSRLTVFGNIMFVTRTWVCVSLIGRKVTRLKP